MGSTVDQIKEKVFSKYQKENWEIKTLGEIAREIVSGNEITKDQLGTGEYPAIRFNQIFNSQRIEIKRGESFVSPDLIKNKRYAAYGDILIATSSNILENLGKSCAYLGEQKCLIGNHILIFKNDQNNKFLSYVLSSKFAKSQIEKLSQKSTVYDLYLSKVKQIKIPLPPLEIQNEIVEFLDKFTELESELNQELESRKKQYEYYKELIFNRGIKELKWELKALEEISSALYNGSEITKEQINTGNYPAIKYKDIYDYEAFLEECITCVDENLIKRKKYCEYGDILFAGVSNKKGTVGKSIAYIGEEKCIVGNEIEVLKHNQNPKFLSYCLSSNFAKRQKENLSQGGAVFNIHIKDVKKIKIPVPSLEEQAKVVKILDKLYSIINDIKEGIPMLIQKNKEQYNFYKELLLGK